MGESGKHGAHCCRSNPSCTKLSCHSNRESELWKPKLTQGWRSLWVPGVGVGLCAVELLQVKGSQSYLLEGTLESRQLPEKHTHLFREWCPEQLPAGRRAAAHFCQMFREIRRKRMRTKKRKSGDGKWPANHGILIPSPFPDTSPASVRTRALAH